MTEKPDNEKELLRDMFLHNYLKKKAEASKKEDKSAWIDYFFPSKEETTGDLQAKLLKSLLTLIDNFNDKHVQDRADLNVTPELFVIKAEDVPRRLEALFNDYQNSIDFSPGDLVTWKAGLQNRRFPSTGAPAVVMETLENARPLENESPDSMYYREVPNMKIGVMKPDSGDLISYWVDSKRFKKFE